MYKVLYFGYSEWGRMEPDLNDSEAEGYKFIATHESNNRLAVILHKEDKKRGRPAKEDELEPIEA